MLESFARVARERQPIFLQAGPERMNLEFRRYIMEKDKPIEVLMYTACAEGTLFAFLLITNHPIFLATGILTIVIGSGKAWLLANSKKNETQI